MDLALNNLQSLICHKTQKKKKSKQPNNLSMYQIKFSLFCFDLACFYGISTNLSYLMSNHLFTYIFNIYDL